VDTPQSNQLVPRTSQGGVSKEFSVGKAVEPKHEAPTPGAYTQGGQFMNILTPNMIVSQHIRQFSILNASRYDSAKKLFKKKDTKIVKLKNKTVNKQSVERKLNSVKPNLVARTMPQKYSGDIKREIVQNDTQIRPILRVVPKQFV